MPFLKKFRMGRPAGEIELGDEELLIGADSFNNLVLDEEGVGKRHALVEKVGARYRVADLGTAAGVIIAGKAVDEHILNDQDVLALGNARLVYVDKEVNPATVALLRAEAGGIHEAAREEEQEEEIEDIFLNYGSKILSCLDIDSIPAVIIDQILTACGAERGIFFSMDDSSGRLVPRIARKMEEEISDRNRFKGIISLVLRSLDQARTINTSTSEEAAKGDESASSSLVPRVIMAGPLSAEGQPHGAVYIDARQSDTSFDEHTVERFTRLRTFSSVAWVNALKYAENTSKGMSYRRMLDGLTMAVIHLDGLGRVVELNSRARQMFGIKNSGRNSESDNLQDKSTGIGCTIEEITASGEYGDVAGSIRAMISSQNGPYMGRVTVEVENSIRNIHLSVSPVGMGTRRSFIVTLYDGTYLDQEIQITSWEEAGIGFEKSALHRIEEMASISEKQKKSAARGGEDLRAYRKAGEEILNHSIAVAGLFEAFENFKSIGEPEMTLIKLEDIFEKRLEPFKRRARHIVFETQFREKLPEVMGDSDQIGKVFSAVVDNAVNAIRGPGRISVLMIPRGNSLITVIEDTGSGMTEAIRRSAFLPGFTTSRDGFGFGLPSVRKIIARHGGTVDILSLQGQGTTVSISLPAAGNKSSAVTGDKS